MRGQIEQLTHQLQQLQAAQRDQYADIDRRLINAQTVADSAKNTAAQAIADLQKKQSASSKAVLPVPSSASLPVPSVPAHVRNVKAASASPVTSATPKVIPRGQPNVQEEQQTYQTAYDFDPLQKSMIRPLQR